MVPQHFAIGVDVGGTNMRAAAISPTGQILRKVAVSGSRDPIAALDIIKRVTEQMGGSNAVAIGIGIPGRVDGRTGQVISGGFLDVSSVDLKAELQMAFGLPVVVANDCSMALIGEARCGGAVGLRNVAMMTIGTGIGGALMENGQVVNGRRTAGQFGHLIVKEGGHPCPCGQRGCVETESSGSSLRRHLDEAGYGPDVRFGHVLTAAEAGNEIAIAVLRSWAGPLRAAARTLSAAFDPDIVLLGGGMGGAALQAMGFLAENPSWYDIEIRDAKLGDDAGVVGAGLAAHDLLAGCVDLNTPVGKRLVMVNGVPASGKSSLGQQLSTKTGWSYLALDTVKNPFLELLEDVDRPLNRVLGRASYKSIFSVIEEAAPGTSFIVDAWFGFQPIEVLKELIAFAGITEVLELWCHAPPEIVGARFSERSRDRLPGHPGIEYVPELIELAKRALPCRLGPVLDIDTSRPIDMDAILQWMKAPNTDEESSPPPIVSPQGIAITQ